MKTEITTEQLSRAQKSLTLRIRGLKKTSTRSGGEEYASKSPIAEISAFENAIDNIDRQYLKMSKALENAVVTIVMD